MSKQEIRVGVMGCGRIAEVAHVPGFLAVPGARIAALLDADIKRAEALRDAKQLDAAVFSDIDAFLDSGLDAVTVCTPNHLHNPLTIKALQRGLHVLCEKPIAGTLADADNMIAAAREADRVLQINQSLRYAPLYATLARLVHDGAIGQPQHIRCIRAGGKTPNKGWSPGADWFVSKAAFGGLLLDIGIHMADCIRWIAGDVIRVSGEMTIRTPDIDVPDNVLATMRHANGCTSVLELSWTFPAGASALEIHGTAGKLQTVAEGSGIELTVVDGEETTVSHPPLDDALPDSYASFIKAIHGEADSPTPGELGRDSLDICLAIAQSHEQGAAIKLAPHLHHQEKVTA